MNTEELQQILSQLVTQVNNLTNVVATLQNQAASVSQPQTIQFPTPLGATTTKGPKTPLPEKFDGNRKNFRDFLASLKVYMMLRSKDFSNENEQVLFVGSLLTGTALSWFRSLLDSNSSALTDAKAFLKLLQETFSDPMIAANARRLLDSAQQGNRPAATYAAEFKRIALDTGYDDVSLCYQFKKGLKQSVRAELVHHYPLPESLDELMTLTIQVDNVLFEGEQEHRFSRRNIVTHRTANSPVPTTEPLTVTPMELGLTST